MKNIVETTEDEEDFVPYDIALSLKELGFNKPCMGRYYHLNPELPIFMQWTKRDNFNGKTINGISPFISVPLFQQAFRFFRKTHKLISTIIERLSMEDNNEYYDWLIKGEDVKYRHFKTYEEAELACLYKLIEIVKNKTNYE